MCLRLLFFRKLLLSTEFRNDNDVLYGVKALFHPVIYRKNLLNYYQFLLCFFASFTASSIIISSWPPTTFRSPHA